MSEQQSMGDLFRQRRAAAAATSKNTTNNNNNNIRQGEVYGTTTKSFADIQREQQQQQRQPQQKEQHPVDDYNRLVRPTGSRGNLRGIGSSTGGSSLQYSNSANTGRRGNISNNGSRGGRQNNRSALPTEQGVINTLLDKFGFVMCADREKELFFHYSEFKEGHSDELNIGDEMEFSVGRAEERGSRRSGGGDGNAENEKLSAFNVRKLPKGTIHWEKEDEPVGKRWRGFVDQIAREEHQQRHRAGGMRDRNSSGSRSGAGAGATVDGVIRTTDDDSNNDDGSEKLEIHYTPSDYASAKPGQPSSRLNRKDIVEFTLVTQRRTGKKYARKITLVQSERDRQREERETKLLQGATLEQGKVVSNNGDFGFLRSTTRVEEVYFHISHILPVDGDGGGNDTVTEGTLRRMLKEGQVVEFYSVNESGGGVSSGDRGRNKGGVKFSARKIKMLPQGSVKFEHTIAEGVTGMVSECPVASVIEPFGRSSDRRKNDRGVGGNEKVGKIRLEEAIMVDNNDGEHEVITHVLLNTEMYPGGTFAISRTGSEVGSWIRPGDVLLFDVVRKVIDGSCHAVPTEFVGRASLRTDERVASATNDTSSSVKPSIRLIEPSLCGRAEGVVRSIHDNFGFIHLAERVFDAYFPLFEVFPAEIQCDLVRNNPDVYHENDFIQNKGGRIHLEVGMEVSFDLSLQRPTNATVGGGRAGDRGGRYGKQSRSSPTAQEKESLRARRVQVLPTGTVKEKISIAGGVKATVIKEDPKQPFVGTLELEESLKVDASSERHPLVAKLLDFISEGKYGQEEVTFHDVLSERDAQVVTSMVNSRNDDLDWSYVPENAAAEGNSHNCKLCIARKKSDDDDEKSGEEKVLEQRITTTTSLEGANNEAADDKEETQLDEGKEQGTENDTATTAAKTAAAGSGGAGRKQDSHKKKSKKAKIVKVLRFDKLSFPDMNIGPLGLGDVVTCDIFQSRRSGVIMVENIAVNERKGRSSAFATGGEESEEDAATGGKSLRGYVTEVMPSRQFGFITPVDEHGSKMGEHVFFHFREVESPGVGNGGGGGDVAQDGSPPSSLGRSKKPGKSNVAVIRKGDEVTFNTGLAKNGRMAAIKVSILPRGTLKISINKANNKLPSCSGYILMEPSHTSLANTPSHVVLQSGPAAGAAGGGSRWDNVRDDKSAANKSGPNAKGGGLILLLSDPSHLFLPKPNMQSPKQTPAGGEALSAGAVSESNAGTNASSSSESNNTGSDTKNDDAVKAENINDIGQDTTQSTFVVVGTHLMYKPSSILATRGFSAGGNKRYNDGPKRGDLVSFGKTRGAKFVKDIRVEKMGAATSVRGVLMDINKEDDTAVFVSSENNGARYDIKLTEVVSCDKSLLKDEEEVDGILHEGKIFGVCRTKDIYLASSFGRKSSGSSSGGGTKERPKLNLTVKKELQGMGGKIMAQSRMAKGPDGTNGFAPGWTKRASLYNVEDEDDEEDEEDDDDDEEEEDPSKSLSAAAAEFVPNFPVSAASDFELVEDGSIL